MSTQDGAFRWQQIAWLGLTVVPCLLLGALVGRWVAEVIGIPVGVGHLLGLIAGYLVSRTLLRRYFAERI